MLRMERIESGYGESVVLRGADLEVKAGQCVCLLGRNGVGKTTLMKTLMGLLKAQKGMIEFEGADLTRKPPEYRARRGIGYVPQGREIFPLLTVYDNIVLGLEAARGNSRGGAIPGDMLETFPVLKEMLQRKGGDLSGGQQQQLAFARALVSKPKLLLLDEPTEGIQPSIVQDIQRTIRSVKAEGDTAILLVEQSVEFVKSVADYYYVMDKGGIVAEGDISTLEESVVKRHLAV